MDERVLPPEAYAEFDDCEVRWSFVSSGKARAAVRELMLQHALRFWQNPGGGAFEGDNGFRCQVSLCDDVYDLTKLRKALAAWEVDE